MNKKLDYKEFLKNVLGEKTTIEKKRTGKFKWVFYNYDFEQKDIMIVGQSPGGAENDEDKLIKNATDPKELIDISRKFLIKYFNTQKMKDFWVMFFDDLNEALNLEINKDAIFNDKNIFFTDTVKQRGSIKKITKDDKFLLEEELRVVKPKLIICFGSWSWNFFKEKYKNLKKVSDFTSNQKVNGVVAEHGYLFQTSDEVYILPLIHYSKISYSNCPRTSYWDFFKEGIFKYGKIKNGE